MQPFTERSAVIHRQCVEDKLTNYCTCKKLEPLDEAALFLWHKGDKLLSNTPSKMYAFKKDIEHASGNIQ